MGWRFGFAHLCCGVLTLALAAHDARAAERVKLFIGTTHHQLQGVRDDAQMRAFIALQYLLDSIPRQLPIDLSDNTHLGDVDSWPNPADWKKLQDLKYTHYLIAEPRTVSYGAPPDSIQVFEIKWHIGSISPDKTRSFAGYLKELKDAKRGIMVPKLDESDPQKLKYSSTELKVKMAGFDGSKESHWDAADVAPTLITRLKKIMLHIFPEMRRKNAFFIECIDSNLGSPREEINIFLMQSLSVILERNDWSSATELKRAKAAKICEADYLISGSLLWENPVKKSKVRPSIRVRGRVAEMRAAYTFSSEADAPDQSETLSEFCVGPAERLLEKAAVEKLATYIRTRGFKTPGGNPLAKEWRCP
jgi:hypothetical protein